VTQTPSDGGGDFGARLDAALPRVLSSRDLPEIGMSEAAGFFFARDWLIWLAHFSWAAKLAARGLPSLSTTTTVDTAVVIQLGPPNEETKTLQA
jgi:hypothetical protein